MFLVQLRSKARCQLLACVITLLLLLCKRQAAPKLARAFSGLGIAVRLSCLRAENSLSLPATNLSPFPLSCAGRSLRSWALRGPNGSAAIRRSRRLRAPQILAERSLQFSFLARGAFSSFLRPVPRRRGMRMDPLVEYGTALVIGTSPCRQKGEGTEGIYAADAHAAAAAAAAAAAGFYRSRKKTQREGAQQARSVLFAAVSGVRRDYRRRRRGATSPRTSLMP